MTEGAVSDEVSQAIDTWPPRQLLRPHPTTNQERTLMSTPLLESIAPKETVRENGITVTSFSLNGDPHAAAIVDAVNAAYPRVDIDFEALIGHKVTLLLGGETMFGASVISTEEATLFRASGGVGYLPKGKRSKGFRLNPAKVMDYVEGFGGVPELAGRVADVRARFPKLEALTKEQLAELPVYAPGDGHTTCTLAVFGHWGVRGYEGTSEALWLVHSYDAEDDICEGVLYVPESVGCSEHGTTYGKDLLRFGGQVVGFQPVTLRTAMEWTDRPHADVLAEVVAAAAGIA